MIMKKGVFVFVAGILTYMQSVLASLETVLLTDVTQRFQADKRRISDPDLSNELTFQLRRGSDNLTLNLKRNDDINPNADIYFVRKLKDGQSVLMKTRNLEKEDVAYYQDRENGAFMTVKCVKRSSEQCNRVINGNIRIGESSYDLRPAEIDVISRIAFEAPGHHGKIYALQDQAHIQREISVQKKDTANVNEKKAENELIALLQRFEGQHKQNHFSRSDALLSSQNVAALQNRGAADKSRQLRDVYHVKVAVLIDSGIWDLYSSTVESLNPKRHVRLVKRKIREAYSHIMNGVNLRYKTIEDPSISINVILSEFIFFQEKDLYPHKPLDVTKYNGRTFISAENYLKNIASWDMEIGANYLPLFDHAMLFTRHNLYLDDSDVTGLTHTGQVCEIGKRTSVVMAGDYVATVWVAAHELGHSLGSWHDGEKDSSACKSEDLFIMTLKEPTRNPATPYSRNPWIFSNCSVEAFKKTLKNKQCVKYRGGFYDEYEYNDYVKKQPGEVYTPNEQCYFANGPSSVLCETVPANICDLMRCTDPETSICMDHYFGAARGTECGQNMWCIEGRCVSKFGNNDLNVPKFENNDLK